ncbi:transcriptional regulator [Streptomyces sp. NBC_01020]|uniref:transcriptional regulator n=1 Tax=unclassified Streptomyces TaxID=2593676 RepID=UPI00224D7DA4|nr:MULTISPECIES: transcriptional regulator [unclassified Streptomyces]MCX4727212.1 transcriptional regulator [Streptomyces sp. NBC_01306]WSV03541.1 transcriptional regulator [Streptomyces sp. NBC_01020]WSX41576.1 transcriptional regulator [Streptomyces sp. NBC_00963]
MYDLSARKLALELVGQGHSLNSVSKQTGISRAAIREWQTHVEPLAHPRLAPCARCRLEPGTPDDAAAYAYLLGLYLGDGCISPHPKIGYYLRIACSNSWPGLIETCREAISAVSPSDSLCLVQKEGCVAVTGYSRHWPCLFPQHGPGKKHDRTIALEPWQQQIVDEYPWPFVRGLIHSDGCRNTNWTTRIVGGERKRYEYPRYWFTNVSDDIRRLYTDTLDKLGVEWKSCTRHSRPYNISVAKRGSVALMDAHVGPKY